MANKAVTIGLCLLLLSLAACQTEQPADEPTPAAVTIAATVEAVLPSATIDLSTAITEGDWSDLLQVDDLGPRREIEHGGFAVDVPEGFVPVYRPGTIIFRQVDGDLSLSVGGGYEPNPISLEAGLENFLQAMSQGISALSTEEYQTTSLDSYDGLETIFRGTLDGDEISGRLMYIQTQDLQFLIVMGFSWTEAWEATGIEAYETMVESVDLFTPTPMENLCPVSADPTFGFSPENPIRVGQGDPITGPRMERDYLNLLGGPNGEPITYVRRGSLPNEDSIVDEYAVTYGDPEVTVLVYLDQYHDGQFRLPQGFSCGN